VTKLSIRLFNSQHAATKIFKKYHQMDSMAYITFTDRVSSTWFIGKYMRTEPLRRGNVLMVK
jgi:hypothetical protein